jgi:hypothetical protein
MEKINEASKKIADIIGVINEIAFQTVEIRTGSSFESRYA